MANQTIQEGTQMKFSRAGDARHLNPGGFLVTFCLTLCLLASLLLFVWAKPVMSMPLTQPVRSLPFDQKTWYEANYDLSFQSCAFRPAALSIEDGILKTTIQKIKDGIICGSVNTWQKYKFGKFCITMMTAHAGAGMNTAFFLYTGQPTHGEIDIEILNKNPRQAQLTVWYHGVSDGGHIVDLGFDSS
ncbi:MAG: glycosyl hydrolase family protein, partial [Rhodospirillaceae bacterium]